MKFHKVSTNKKKNYYSIQYGVPGSVHPIIFFSPKKLITLMRKMKYRDTFRNSYNTTKNSKEFYYGDILFEKK